MDLISALEPKSLGTWDLEEEGQHLLVDIAGVEWMGRREKPHYWGDTAEYAQVGG